MEYIAAMMLALVTLALGMTALGVHLCGKQLSVEAESPGQRSSPNGLLPRKCPPPEPIAVGFGWSQALA